MGEEYVWRCLTHTQSGCLGVSWWRGSGAQVTVGSRDLRERTQTEEKKKNNGLDDKYLALVYPSFTFITFYVSFVYISCNVQLG